ncbi:MULTISPECIES: teichuronic acid biosynthesis protein TuaF [Bacillus]|uniref:Sulfur relay protein TusF n=2 Tax=Bacillus TaxID=1386 RepID=A0A0M3RA38_9BACI|nr:MULTISPECIES: hypothetical protein [Bacillus]ALC82512.1 sulfur relay protein TusF [Bacillus gobiensis]MBP1081413.1 teichuronic acid biosynthesis protein TuaF [Bacillus capparidis]MED1096085.1 hypothetical protein [Bacillus capparidis]
MNGLLKRIGVRIKKYIVFLIVLPLLLGIVGYFISPSVQTNENTASITIKTGSYNDASLNDTKEIPVLLTSDSFLKETFPDFSSEQVEEVKQKLMIEIQSNHLFQLSYQGEDSSEILKKISETFMAKDQKLFSSKQSVIQSNIEELENEAVSDDSKVDKQRFLYELETTMLTIEPAQTIYPLTAEEETKSAGMSAKKRVVLGVLIGLAISFCLVVVPEIFRETND